MAYTEKTVPSDCVNSGNMKSVPRIVIIHKSLQPWQAQCLFKTVNRQLIVYSIWLVMIHDWLIIPLQMQLAPDPGEVTGAKKLRILA